MVGNGGVARVVVGTGGVPRAERMGCAAYGSRAMSVKTIESGNAAFSIRTARGTILRATTRRWQSYSIIVL